LAAGGASVGLRGAQLTDLRPVKSVQRGSALNKAGRLVLCGEWQGKPIKLYEAAGLEHAHFIQSVCTHNLLAECFPHVQALHGRFLQVEWVESKDKRAPSPDVLANLLHRVHNVPVAAFSNVGFDYWHDHLRSRFVRAAHLFGIEGLAQHITAKVDTHWSNSRQFLMHPDLTPSNVVLDAQGNWKVIDNELLTVGGLPFLDLCNAAYGAGSAAGQLVAELYLAQTRQRLTPQQVSVLNAAWFARVIGSSFVGGELDAIQDLVNRYQGGESILPIQLHPST
jgi:hypothetical protein